MGDQEFLCGLDDAIDLESVTESNEGRCNLGGQKNLQSTRRQGQMRPVRF